MAQREAKGVTPTVAGVSSPWGKRRFTCTCGLVIDLCSEACPAEKKIRKKFKHTAAFLTAKLAAEANCSKVANRIVTKEEVETEDSVISSWDEETVPEETVLASDAEVKADVKKEDG